MKTQSHPHPKYCVVGATGAVGREALAILASRGVPASHIVAAASPRSVGTTVPYADTTLPIVLAEPRAARGCDVALLCASSDVARQLAHPMVSEGALVVDNSSAFRHDPAVPLVVPEVNLHAVQPHHRLIANPNCSTILLVMAVAPLRARFGLTRIDVATYQAVSGAGAGAMHELRDNAHATLHGHEQAPKVFKEPCAFNVFSHNSHVDESTGLNGEETKIIRETRRIFADESLEVCPMCVRVPVFRAHAEAVTLTLARDASVPEVLDALRTFPGLRIIDDRHANDFPTSLKAAHGDDVLVGRVRLDPSSPNPDRSRRVCLFLAGDQLRKGAAQNAIQIADHIRRPAVRVA